MSETKEEQTLRLKKEAAAKAVEFVESDMVIGLGTGSTAILTLSMVAERLASGHLQNIVGIPTSIAIENEARNLGIPLTTLEAHPVIDLTIDGADEVDPNFDVIKGGGGALLREKIVAQASKREIIIVDSSKPSNLLGTKWAVPIEIIPFGWDSQRAFLQAFGAKVVQRTGADGQPFRTDHGNFILDCDFGPIPDVSALAEQLNQRAGIVEHGLFINLVTDVIIASEDGIEHKIRSPQP